MKQKGPLSSGYSISTPYSTIKNPAEKRHKPDYLLTDKIKEDLGAKKQ